jgi:hypothetical protein
MKYTHEEVLDILKDFGNPEVILDNWNLKKANELLDLSEYRYPVLLYSFPVELDNRIVATVTLARFANTGFDGRQQKLMCKYFTPKVYRESWMSFSHDTYLHCYLTIHEKFELDKFHELSFKDVNGKIINYHLYDVSDRSDNPQYWFDNDVCLDVLDEFDGWEMGEKINETINQRLHETFSLL